MTAVAITPDDRYGQADGRVWLTGAQALVRVAIDQARRDAAAGLRTAGFVSGYRGSPLGTFDNALWQAADVLKAHDIVFQPGLNEDLAATAVWGTQQAAAQAGAGRDGVFSLWYGKGPGVDRSADAIKHGNYAGTSRKGGVLLLCGDDHAARSSTVAHQSDHVLIHCGVPILNPANLQDYLDYGALGFALSRYSASWVGFKCITDTVDGSASLLVDPARLRLTEPDDYRAPPGGLWIRNEVAALAQESRLFEERLLAAQAFARANRFDAVTIGGPGRRRLGIVTSGKSHGDVGEALRMLGIDGAAAARLGIAVFKVAMVWPLEPQAIRRFAAACDELLVVEEKRAVIEPQLATLLFNLPAGDRPRLSGKREPGGRPLLSEVGELSPAAVLAAIVARYDAHAPGERLADRRPPADPAAPAPSAPPGPIRTGAFCAGCPHNLSTRVPEGSVAAAGIGCHGMASLMPERLTAAGVQMGGEGAQWIGQAPFVSRDHIFQNLGDGTYFHSGLLAIRACVAAGVNITYKILLNGVVGMTGGQPIEGQEGGAEASGPSVARQVHAEGVGRIAVVADDPARLARDRYPAIATFHHRDALDAVQRELREHRGVSVLIYDQACATERRRLRKRGRAAPATSRLFINSRVCEGCGDCGIQSNCIALEPVATDFGRKRRINQSSCNQDYSCLKGFCPSFVTVTGGRLRRRAGRTDAVAALAEGLPAPTLPATDGGYALLLAGIGGSGIVTMGAILGMAAHLDGTPCTVLDMSGFAQRNGSVTSHVRFAPADGLDHTARIPAGGADAVVAADAIVAAGAACLPQMRPGTRVVVNGFVAPTSSFAQNPDLDIDVGRLCDGIAGRVGADNVSRIDASDVAATLLGDAIGGNLLLIGYAWQAGLVPVTLDSLLRAIELNGAAVAMNRAAFMLGRVLRADPAALAEVARPDPAAVPGADDLERIVERQSRHLAAYQDEALAQRYRALVARAAAAEDAVLSGSTALSRAVATVFARLLSYKDEYEVARLFAGDDFRRELAETFEGDFTVSYNLAPPFLPAAEDAPGRPAKRTIGPWALPLFRLLARMKRLRGTPLDPFGYHPHRRIERRLIVEFETMVEELLMRLARGNLAHAAAMVRAFGGIRGYGIVKETSIARVRQDTAHLRKLFDAQSAAASRSASDGPCEGRDANAALSHNARDVAAAPTAEL